MTRQYTVEETGVIWYEENGFRVSFMPDPANSDYQAYLNKDKPQVEHLTEIPTKGANLATLASELSNPSTQQAGE